MKNWICASCGQEVLAGTRPQSMKWSDGHRCSFALQVPEVAPAAGPKLLAALTQLVTHDYPQLTVGCVDGTELHIEDDDETYIRLVVKTASSGTDLTTSLKTHGKVAQMKSSTKCKFLDILIFANRYARSWRMNNGR
jgi:hypothetical protein